MAEMALTFLSPVIEEALSQTVSFVNKKVGAAVGLEKELDRFCDSLTLIQSVIQHAEERQESDPAIRRWLQKLKDVAYEAMDALGECEYKVLKHKVKSHRHWNPESAYFSPLFRSRMADKINNITKQLNYLKDWASMINLVVSWKGQTCPRQYPKTDSFLDSFTVFKREDDVSKILSLMHDLRGQHPISGISIVGMAGIGKTTVAKSVYMKAKEEKLYDLAAWVCVSEHFNDEIILGEMLEHFGCSGAPRNSINALLEHLSKELEDKTFLLILDDVWNEDPDKGELFSSRLLKILNTIGSSIVITTRSGKVASAMESIPMQSYDMERLSDDVCWLMIKEKFLRSSTETSIPTELEAVGQDIAKKCGGLPLIANVIGGTLSHQIGAKKWKDIRDDEAWNLNSQAGDKVLFVLKISFNHLSPPLKKCFSYCSIFPKDFVIEKDDLVQLWMAQGFLDQPDESSVTMEDVGNDYFSDLISNSLFQDVGRDKYGNINSCKMHDVVHDLALYISRGDTLVWEIGCRIDQNAKIRHLRVKHDQNERPVIPRSVAQKLHSLFLDEVDLFISHASDLKSLRALKIVGAKGQLPINFNKLKHLKYLDISRSEIKTLPKSFFKLYKLQTFRLMGYFSLQMSEEMRNLISLRHFYFDNKGLMPREIGHLTSLQALPLFVVSRANLDQLGCLSQLGGKLGIWKLELVRSKLEASKANLKEKKKLHQLELRWSKNRKRAVNNSNNDEEVLESLQPHSALKSLTIDGYEGKKFPSWMISGVNSSGSSFLPNNMVELMLINCNECSCIPSLGLLPSLKVLYIDGMENVRRMGYELRASGVELIKLFPALKTLAIRNMQRLEEWVEVDEDVVVGSQGGTVFPCLEELELYNCQLLKTWSISGFSSHHKLSKLRINSCSSLMAIPNLDGLSTLKTLELQGCSELRSLPIGLGSCIYLQSLQIVSCRNLNSIPSIKRLISLERVLLSFCDGLTSLPIGLGSCISLQQLEIECCPNLISIPEDIGKLCSLNTLGIAYCDNLISIPEDIGKLCSLNILRIRDCKNLKSIQTGLGSCISLQQLVITSCPNLISISEDVGKLYSLTRLRELRMGPFWTELEEFPGLTSFYQLHAASPEVLVLYGWDKLKSLPLQLQHLTALKKLGLYNFNGLKALPEWLGDLSSLQELEIWRCSNLTHLPSIEAMRHLSNLQYLLICECPKLRERCAKNRGPEWSKISHIPNIHV